MTADQLRKSILQQAIQGKLVPQDPNDEPASVLLERIREEKARLVEEKKIKKEKNPSVIFRAEDNSYYEKFTLSGEVKCIDEEIPFEIPKDWRWVRFGQIVKLNIGKTPPRDDSCYWLNAKRNWVSISDMTNYGRIKTTKEQISEEAANFLMRESSPINTLLMSFKLTVGRTAILDIEAYHNEAIVSIYPYIDKKFMLRNYLFYTLPILANIGDSKDAIKGKTLNSKSLNNLLIPLPPLNEQQRIVEKIEELIPHIEHYGKAQTELDLLNRNIKEQLKKSILQYAIEGKLVPQDETEGTAEELLLQIQKEKLKLYEENKLKKKDLEHSIIFKGEDNKYYEKIGKNVICIDEEIPFEIPKNWRWCRVRDLGLTETGTTPPKSNPNFFGDHIPFLSPANIQQNRIANENQWLSKEGMLYGRVVPCNSILQVCIGGSIGKCAIVNKSVTFNQQINSITPILCEPKFLYYYLLSNTFFLAMIEKSTGTATPIINKGNWERLLFPLPPLAEQLRIVESIDAIFRCIEN